MMNQDKDRNSSSHYGTFLDNYNSGNVFLNNISGSFLEKINSDKNIIIQNGDGLMKAKFQQIDKLQSDPGKTNYEKIIMVGEIIQDIAPDIIGMQNPEIKKSGINVIVNFLNVAKETEDRILIDTAKKISGTLKF
jgi:hypothetical protein